jgi:hypothetical protein
MDSDWHAYDVQTPSGQTVHVYFVGTAGRSDLSIPDSAELSLPFEPGQKETPFCRYQGSWTNLKEAKREISCAAERFVSKLG